VVVLLLLLPGCSSLSMGQHRHHSQSPAMFDFSHLWQQEELSDVTLVVAHAPDAGTQEVLQRLPGHGALLSVSPFFKAMVGCNQTTHLSAKLHMLVACFMCLHCTSCYAACTSMQ
jgi:hypothetical protein